MDKYRALVKRSRETVIRGFVADVARQEKDEIEVEEGKAKWETRKESLPVFYRHYIMETERAGRTSAKLYGELRDDKLWPAFPKRRRGHAPMSVTEVAGNVFVSLALPSYMLEKLGDRCVSFTGAIRAMTTWGGDGLLRDDVEEAWFGEPGMLGNYIIGGRAWGMLDFAGLFLSGRVHRRVEIVIPAELYETVETAAARVHSTAEQWIYGCVAAFDRDSKGSNSCLNDRRRVARRELEEWKGGRP